eukprot:CAMPEP_0204336080 /NCGR_PEP_ID=MMETSP0469-20131031/19272_1 /ASSEMBLY_ACC=CAM_ASM_000384 /TAXON_ID=2969 /ORGANISM="Oxyrrhis marina" /LENGTH=641 /DNA_ID=CAMNT_0051319891 /DNA_START=62 /DNA_END=1987 /DNA_ORIENTATION=+
MRRCWAESVVAYAVCTFFCTLTLYVFVALLVPAHTGSSVWLHEQLLVFLTVASTIPASWFLTLALWGNVTVGRVRSAMKADWFQLYTKSLSEKTKKSTDGPMLWEDVRHFVIIVNYKEPLPLLRKAISNLAVQVPKSLSASQTVVVLAMEERENGAREKAAILREEFKGYFQSVLASFHPGGKTGEINGKASNYKWAVGVVEDHCRANSVSPDRALVHVLDADSMLPESYLAAVTFQFCTVPDRYFKWWQPVMLQSLNFWEVPAMARLTSMMTACHELAAVSNPFGTAVPFSTWAVPLKTLKQIGKGSASAAQDPDVIADDHHLFVKGFFELDGRLQVQSVPLPVPNFAAGSKGNSYVDNLHERWIQAKRHTFGVAEFEYLVERAIMEIAEHGLFAKTLGFWRRYLGLFVELGVIHCMAVVSGIWMPLGTLLLLYRDATRLCSGETSIMCHILADRSVPQFNPLVEVAYQIVMGTSTAAMCVCLLCWVRAEQLAVAVAVDADVLDTIAPAKAKQVKALLGKSGTFPITKAPEVATNRYAITSCFKLLVDFAFAGVPSAYIYGGIPGLMAQIRLLHDHTFEYVTCLKQPRQTEGPSSAPAPPRPVEKLAPPERVLTAQTDGGCRGSVRRRHFCVVDHAVAIT